MLQYRGFIGGVLLASVLWSLGLIYITYNNVHLHNDHVRQVDHVRQAPPSEDIERWATHSRRTRLPHDSDKEILYKKMRQMKRATPSEVQSNQVLLQKSPQREAFKSDNELSERIQSHNNRIIPIQRKETVQQQSPSRQLFISDKPVVVKNFLSWKEAEKTRTAEEERQSKDGFARHAFNQYASDRLGYFREIPDTRHTL